MTHDCAGCGAELAFAADGGVSETPNVATILEGLPDNWGRWGDDDERGTLNLLGGAEAAAGMRAALAGGDDAVERFTLGLPLTGEAIEGETDTGDPAFPGREIARRDNLFDERSYREGEMDPLAGMRFSDDRFVAPFAIQGTTHLDALGHAWYGDTLYNGFDPDETARTKEFETPLEGFDGEVTETRGLGHLSIEPLADAGVASRGVLLDVARHRSGDEGDGDTDADGDADADAASRLPMGAEITLADLQATADAQGVTVGAGDVLLVHTGSMARTRDPEAAWDPTNEPGLVFSEELVEWIADRDVAVLGADNVAVERVTQSVGGETYVLPLHGAFLRNLGLPLAEMLWLDDLAAACARDGVYEFLFTAAPLSVQRATGGVVNPVVLKASD